MSENNHLTARLISLFAFLCLFCVPEIIGQPDWTQRRPVDPEYYIGIGSAGKTPGTSLHIEQARDQALAQIASSIAVSITTETTHNILEQTGVFEEQFSAITRTLASANLEGYELVDTWEDDQVYWVYYRLSVDRYANMLETGKRNAAQQAERYYDHAKQAFSDGNIALSLGYLMQAAYVIQNYRGLGLLFSDAEAGFIDVDVYLFINEILSGMRLVAQPQTVQTKLFKNHPDTLQVSLSYTQGLKEPQPVKFVPLDIQYHSKKEIQVLTRETDKNGSALLLLPQIRSVGVSQVDIRIDLLQLGGISNRQETTMLKGVNVPSALIPVLVEQPRVFFETDEVNIDSSVIPPVSDSKIRSYLTAGGWIVTDHPENAEFLVKIVARTRAGVHRQGIHTAFATGSMAIYKTDSYDKVFDQTLQQERGAGLDFKSAGNQALERLSEQILEKFKYHLYTN